MIHKEILIFDLDDTLLMCNRYYSQTLQEFVNLISNTLKISTDIIYTCFSEADAKLYPLMHFHYMRFPVAMLDTYENICLSRQIPHEERIQLKILELGMRLLNVIPKQVKEAEDTIKRLAQAGHPLFIFTAGSPNVQMHKINNTWVKNYVSPENIYITQEKNGSQLNKFVNYIKQQYPDVTKENIYMIGDNLITDIMSAMDVGVRAIYLADQDTNKYNKETLLKDVNCVYAKKITDLPKILYCN